MEVLVSRLNKALLTRIELNRSKYAKAIEARVEGFAAREAPRIRRLKLDIDSLFVHARRQPAAPALQVSRRIKRLELRGDYADGGLNLARALDEGHCFAGSGEDGSWA